MLLLTQKFLKYCKRIVNPLYISLMFIVVIYNCAQVLIWFNILIIYYQRCYCWLVLFKVDNYFFSFLTLRSKKESFPQTENILISFQHLTSLSPIKHSAAVSSAYFLNLLFSKLMIKPFVYIGDNGPF